MRTTLSEGCQGPPTKTGDYVLNRRQSMPYFRTL